MNPDQYNTLNFISEYGPVTIEDIAMVSYVSLREATRVVKHLDEQGLIVFEENKYAKA